jgi:nuclear pore complex protein Nup188
MQLLVPVFQGRARTDIYSLWLKRCQETSILQASMELFVQTDLRPGHGNKRSAPHKSSTSMLPSVERLARERVLVACRNSSMTTTISSDVTFKASEALLIGRIVSCVPWFLVSSLPWVGQSTSFDTEASAFIQLVGNQITRAFSWTVGDSRTLAWSWSRRWSAL